MSFTGANSATISEAYKGRGALFFVTGLLLMIAGIGLALLTETWYFLLIPFAPLLVFVSLFNLKYLYYCLLFSIPLSIPLTFGPLGLDFISEPLMWWVTLLVFILILTKRDIDFSFMRHPVTLLLLAQFAWISFTSFFSVNPFHSIKFILAKIWYLAPFYFLTLMVVRSINDVKPILLSFLISLCLVAVKTSIGHWLLGLGFETANIPIQPFFFNHVLYSSTLCIFLPFIIFARQEYSKSIFSRTAFTIAVLAALFGIGFAYTRVSWLGVFAAIGFYIAMQYKLSKPAVAVSLVAAAMFVLWLMHDNKFMDYAPDYHTTIFHKGDIAGHLEATYELKDVSGMERVYRWLAAKNMIASHPWLGSGPNTFYPEYKHYTLQSFFTYVSHNPEHSTTHNYFLMVFSEQGIVGFLLFASLCIYLLFLGIKIYENPLTKRSGKNLAAATVVSLVVLYIHLLLNDLIETDKIGSIFYISCAILVKLDGWSNE